MFDIVKTLYGCEKIYGPYVGGDGRKRCVLYFKNGQTSSRSYAKLIVEARLGRLLTDDEQTDHIDDDCTNDSPDNLQVLTKEQNLLKQSYKKLEETINYGFHCYVCEKPFILLPSERRQRLKVNKTERAICSIVCKNINNSELNSLPKDTQDKIKQLKKENISNVEIARILNVSEYSVIKYSKR